MTVDAIGVVHQEFLEWVDSGKADWYRMLNDKGYLEAMLAAWYDEDDVAEAAYEEQKFRVKYGY